VPPVFEVSDEDALVELVDDVLLDPEPNCEIRLCRLAASLPGPPTASDESLDPLDVDELLPCDCKTDIRFCRKLPIACAAFDVLDDELVEFVPVALVELLDVPLLLESLVPVTPICDKALAMAPIKPPPLPPPPPGGGGGGKPPMELPESLLPDCVLNPICDVK